MSWQRMLTGIALVSALACATAPRSKSEGTLRVFATETVPLSCGRDRPIEVRHGALPVDAVHVAFAESLATKMRVGLADHEALAKPLASRMCADGVSVLQAVEEEGAVTSTKLEVWKRLPPAASAPEG